jgi:hypothetical protein
MPRPRSATLATAKVSQCIAYTDSNGVSVGEVPCPFRFAAIPTRLRLRRRRTPWQLGDALCKASTADAGKASESAEGSSLACRQRQQGTLPVDSIPRPSGSEITMEEELRNLAEPAGIADHAAGVVTHRISSDLISDEIQWCACFSYFS